MSGFTSSYFGITHILNGLGLLHVEVSKMVLLIPKTSVVKYLYLVIKLFIIHRSTTIIHCIL